MACPCGRDEKIWPTFSGITFKHLLLPFWITAFMYRDKLYHVAINAQTGKVHGEFPISKIKVALAILAIVAVIVGIFFLGMYLEGLQS